MIEVKELTKRYGDRTVVDRLTFTVRPGKVTKAPGEAVRRDRGGGLRPVGQVQRVPALTEGDRSGGDRGADRVYRLP